MALDAAARRYTNNLGAGEAIVALFGADDAARSSAHDTNAANAAARWDASR
jgi:hypothetical protein